MPWLASSNPDQRGADLFTLWSLLISLQKSDDLFPDSWQPFHDRSMVVQWKFP
jgi:hypothetical protein